MSVKCGSVYVLTCASFLPKGSLSTLSLTPSSQAVTDGQDYIIPVMFAVPVLVKYFCHGDHPIDQSPPP